MSGVSHSALMLSYGGGGGFSVEYLGETNGPDFTGVDFGAAASDRRIMVVYHWSEAGSHSDLANPTIGGISATIHAQTGHTGGLTGFGVAAFSAAVPTGTSGTITVNHGGLQPRRIGVWRITGEEHTTPVDTDTDQTVGTSDDVNGAVTVEEGGVVFGGYSGSTGISGSSVSWNTLDEVYDADRTVRVAAAWRAELSADGSYGVNVNAPNTSDAGNGLVLVSWR